MSVATRNPFSVLDAEDPSRPGTPPPEPAKEASPVPSRGTQKTRGGNSSRGGRYYSRGGARGAHKDSSQAQNGAEEPSPEPKKFEGSRGRGRGRGGDRGDRGERGERGGGRGGRRPFDRHSQTGKTDSDKKIHQGWGGDDGKEEFKTEQAATVDAAAEGDAWGAPAAEEEKPESRPRKEREEEEDHTLTLEQYLAQQKEKDALVPKLDKTRKANEGTDENIWKNTVPLTRDEEKETYFVGKTKSAPKARAKKEEKVFIEIDAHFDRPERGGRGRGRGDRARGGGRGRGGNRGGRQNGSSAPALSVHDETAFPSLS
ncbi:hypothetical protein F5887DRAFT_410956 [Amanita rubescens]|nr:hypothetical protein F5887DRAFT_410956 [Amanita rubescens]